MRTTTFAPVSTPQVLFLPTPPACTTRLVASATRAVSLLRGVSAMCPLPMPTTGNSSELLTRVDQRVWMLQRCSVESSLGFTTSKPPAGSLTRSISGRNDLRMFQQDTSPTKAGVTLHAPHLCVGSLPVTEQHKSKVVKLPVVRESGRSHS